MLQHNHLILKGTIKKAPTADALVETSLWIEDFIMGNGMQLASKPVVSYVEDEGNKGVTACCLLKTSHMAFHIWDEQDPALIQFDFYTCGELDIDKAIEMLNSKFDFDDYKFMVLNRAKNIDEIVFKADEK